MNKRRKRAAQRAVAAYLSLRGRPLKPDYGILLVFPFLASAGGSLAALAVEMMIERRRAQRRGSKISAPGAGGADEDMYLTVDRP